jgi:putative peptidoglycan lipid II flippase
MAGAAALVMLFFVLSRVTGLAREMVIGAQFGTSGELDTYLAAFRIPDLIFQLVAGGALGSAFIPTFAETLAQSGREAAWRLFSRALNLMVLLLVILAMLAALLAQPLVTYIIAPGFSPDQQAMTAGLMRWMLISTVIFGASGLIMGALNAVQHFALPAAAPVVYNGAIILGAWLLAPSLGIYGLVIGVVAGALGHFGVQLPALLAQRFRHRLELTWRDPGVQEVGRLMAPRVLGLFFVQLNFLVNTILASGLAEGSLAALNYAWLLMLLPQGIFAQAIATVAFPTFASQIARGETDSLTHTLNRTLSVVIFLTIPAAVLLYLLRVPVIQILFERGNFTAQSTQAVAYALQFYALGLVAHALVEIIVRVFYALHDTFTPVLIGVGAMILNIGLSLLWVNGLSYGGLALANSAATGLEMVALFWLLGGKFQRVTGATFSLGPIGRSGLRSLLAAGMMGAGVWWWLGLLAQRPAWSEWLPGGWVAGGSGLILALLLYLGASLLLGGEEIRAGRKLLQRGRG